MVYYDARGRAMPETSPEQGRIAGTSAGNETISAPAGHTSVSGEGGGDLLIGSSGDNTIWITHPKDRVQEQAGGGIDTMKGWTSVSLAPNVENLQVYGQFNYAVGNELANLIIVDDTSHWVYGAKGDDVLVGAETAKVTFVVKAGEGSDVIYNWNGNSQVQFLNYGFSTTAQVKAAMTQQGADVVLNLGNGETLTFRDETLAMFQDRQFLMPLDLSKLGAITFSDEFEQGLQIYDPSLQTGKWRADFGGNLKDEWAYTLTSNGERQVYTKPGFYGQGEADLDFNPFSITGGVLTIEAERIPDEKRDAAWGREYSSGMLNTFGMFEQQYGYFEMKAELPTAAGSWPAFWMMPIPYVAQVEADIMEGLAVTPHVDYRRAWGGEENLYDNTYKIDVGGMHTYGMLWTPTTVTFYYDRVAVLQAPTPANWTEPMAMIVNMAVGGWGGEPNSLQFPDTMKIDYVRAYALSEGGTIVQTGEPEVPAATLRADGALTSGQANVTTTFESDGQAVSTAKIAVYAAKPAALPPGKTFVIWEDAGAVFGAVSNGSSLGTPTALMAGSSSTFTGSGTWLSDGKVALAYMMPDGTGKAAWVMVFDPAKNAFTRHELGPSTGDIDIIATKNGGFAASWDAPGGTVHARGYDAFAYDGEGWYGPVRQVAGDLTGVTATGELIATTPGGQQQLYDMINPPPAVNAVISVGPMAGVTHDEGASGATLYTFTLIRDWDQSQKSTVGWTVRGQGANPADVQDFQNGSFPSGVVTFEINQTTAYVQVWVQGDSYQEANEEFLVTLVNPVGAKLGQATATGFITNDDTGGGPPPASPQLGFTNSTLSLAEGQSGSTAFTFTVARSGATTGTSTVTWTVNGASPSDFAGGTMPTGSLTFAPGDTSKTLTVDVAGDTVVEGDEAFTVTLSNASGATLGTATATGTIMNDDGSTGGGGQVITSPGPGSTVTGGTGNDTLIASQGADVLTGGAGADQFSFKAPPWSAGKITDFVVGTDKLDFSAMFQTAGYAGSDPVADGRVRIEADSAGAKIYFDKDAPNTGDWPFLITQLQGVSASGLTWAQLTGGGGTTPPPAGAKTISLGSGVTLAEGNSGSTAFNFTVTRSGDATASASATWTVTSSTAAASDFAGGTMPTGTVTFAAGETTQTIRVNIAGDTVVETDESFTLTLSNAAGGTLGAATATGVITNDDQSTGGGGGQVITSPGPGSTVTGGTGNDTLIASQGADVLTGGAGADQFSFKAPPWSAGKITDFVVGTDKLDFSAMFQTAGYAGSDPVADGRVRIEADSAGAKIYFDKDAPNTGDWPFLITQLQGVSASGLTWAQLTGGGGTTPPPAGAKTISLGSGVTLAEGNSGSTAFNFTVTRSGDATASASATWTVTSSTAAPSDFAGGTMPTGTVSFAAGEITQTIRVNVAGDTVVEADESFTLTLSNAAGGTLGNASVTGVISNDDAGSGGNAGQTIRSPGPGSTLTGTSGADTLIASQGQDVLTGAGGADRFVYENVPWNAGRITDFTPGVDKIDLRQIFDQTSYSGTTPIQDGYLRLEADGANTKVYFDADAAGTAQQWAYLITTLQGVAPSAVQAGDWIIQ